MDVLWGSRVPGMLQGYIRTYSRTLVHRKVYLLPVLFTAILNAQPAAL